MKTSVIMKQLKESMTLINRHWEIHGSACFKSLGEKKQVKGKNRWKTQYKITDIRETGTIRTADSLEGGASVSDSTNKSKTSLRLQKLSGVRWNSGSCKIHWRNISVQLKLRTKTILWSMTNKSPFSSKSNMEKPAKILLFLKLQFPL